MCNAELLSTTCLLRFNETCYGELENCNSPINLTMIHIAKFSIFQVTKDAFDAAGDRALFLLIFAHCFLLVLLAWLLEKNPSPF